MFPFRLFDGHFIMYLLDLNAFIVKRLALHVLNSERNYVIISQFVWATNG